LSREKTPKAESSSQKIQTGVSNVKGPEFPEFVSSWQEAFIDKRIAMDYLLSRNDFPHGTYETEVFQ
jgi:hypothetical protein